jgi:hypothetical protein
MKRPVRNEDDGMYHIKGSKYPELFGSRTQVMNKTAYKTSGNLTKEDLLMNKWGRIVSAKKHKTAKKEKRLEKAGYYAKKGKFGYVKRKTRKNKSQKKKMKGGDRDCATKEEMDELVNAMGEEEAKAYVAHKGMKPC